LLWDGFSASALEQHQQLEAGIFWAALALLEALEVLRVTLACRDVRLLTTVDIIGRAEKL